MDVHWLDAENKSPIIVRISQYDIIKSISYLSIIPLYLQSITIRLKEYDEYISKIVCALTEYTKDCSLSDYLINSCSLFYVLNSRQIVLHFIV